MVRLAGGVVLLGAYCGLRAFDEWLYMKLMVFNVPGFRLTDYWRIDGLIVLELMKFGWNGYALGGRVVSGSFW